MCLSTTDEEGRKVKKTTAIITIVIALVLLFSCVFALCACNERTNPNAFKNDTRFAVDYDNLNMMDMNKKLVGIIVEAAIDKNNTYFEFKKDGTSAGFRISFALFATTCSSLSVSRTLNPFSFL